MAKDIVEGADLFCGGSGSSSAFVEACKQLGKRPKFVAVNHNPLAVATHRLNHPTAKHFCQDIRTINPREAVPAGHLDILLAGMPCPQYSVARGGRPYDEQERMLPFEVVRWISELDVDDIILENVHQFMDWGPLLQKLDGRGRPVMDPKTGKPWMVADPERRGQFFADFIGRIRNLGYAVEWRVLNSADYGAATIRRRLFILCRKRRQVSWPLPTHTKATYTPARDIIDWSIRGQSIFQRKKPLADATLRRIFTGLRRTGGEIVEPFLVMLYGTNDVRSIKKPLPTVTAQGGHIGLAIPHISVGDNGNGHGHQADLFANGPVALPPYMIPFWGEREGQTPRTHSVDDPTPTVTSHGAGALVEPFLMPVNHGKDEMRTHSLNEPMRTITGWDAWALIEPQIMKYFGTGIAKPVSMALDTITTKDRFALIQPAVTTEIGLDILFRMLQPHELARAMGFSKDYRFLGSRRDVVRMVGNAWELHVAIALCKTMLAA